jgi:putative transposase
MKASKYTEEQIAFSLRQAETGTRVREICRKMGISEQTFYCWKKKYGGRRRERRLRSGAKRIMCFGHTARLET